MIRRLLLVIILAVLLIFPYQPVHAQSDGDLPVYIVQAGDTLNLIAIRFGISVADLIDANDLANPDLLDVGTPLKIPGLEGVSGTLTTDVAGLGATLTGLSRQYQFPVDILVKLNRITSPAEIFIGQTLVLPSLEGSTTLTPVSPLDKGESVFEKAIASGQNPWSMIVANSENGSSFLVPGDSLYILSDTTESSQFNSDLVEAIDIHPLPLVQGKTVVISMKTRQPASLSGELNGMPLNFQLLAENEYVAIQGVHALAPTGLTDIKIQAEADGINPFRLEQAILIESGYYPQDPALYVDEQTIDPAFTGPEDQEIRDLVTPSTPERYWSGIFKQPVDDPVCIKSWFGNRRSYNGSPYSYFHTGVDYGTCASLNIYTPAAGKVVFSGELTVRGNATIIDHGWGIYTGIYHQSKSFVSAGDYVEAGQLIGEIGRTGRVTGPHLHWEVWANGVQVEPLDWLDKLYPEDFLSAP